MPDLAPVTVQADPEGFALLAASLLAFAFLAVRPLRWLSPAGAAAAWVLGMASAWSFGWAGVAGVFAPFAVATLLGRLPGVVRSGPRTARQVVCNGLTAFVGCAAAAAGDPVLGLGYFLGGLACLGADTCATEVGVRYGGPPFRLTGGAPVARGESGGVTGLGLAASLPGALLAPGAFAILTGAPLGFVGAMAATGVAGGLIDSVLGGTLQYRGRDPATGRVVEKRWIDGRPTEHHAGLAWLDNDTVNLASGLAAGVLAAGLLGLLGN